MALSPDHMFCPWGSKMVAEIDLICRSKIPAVPDLDADIDLHCARTDYDYDFIHERQIVADFDQYWDEKRRTECCAPSPSPQTTCGQMPDLHQRQNSSTFACAPTTTVASSSVVRFSRNENLFETVCSFTPPAAARHLQFSQILRPSKSETGTLPNAQSADVIASALTTGPGEQKLCISDFDRGPDDPFATAELNTINELEELRKVLSSTTSQAPQYSHLSWSTQSQSSPVSFARPPSVLFNTQPAVGTNPSNVGPVGASTYRPVSITQPPLPYVDSETNVCGSIGSPKPTAVPFRMPLSSSVPNIQVPHNLTK